MSETRLWGGRFQEDTDALVEAFNASVEFDRRMYRQDIAGSIAHATMLETCDLLTEADRDAIVGGLRSILADIEAGTFEWKTSREDVHMNIEAALAERIGDAAGRLHTARSRNDQVALDVRLWLRESLLDLAAGCAGLQRSLVTLAEAGKDMLMPGYTHLQRAQPIVAAHHLLAYFEMLERDGDRFLDAFHRTNVLPLGSGALAATPLAIDRALVQELLHFDDITRNSIDAVSDRDFVAEALAHAALCQTHLSRLSEELVLWMSQEFGFIALSDAFCTGSSIMPQKKNPDIPELVRGKTGRVLGSLVNILTVLKGLPLAYNKDMQEDKEPLFDAVDTVRASLEVTARMLDHAEWRPAAMRKALDAGFLTATDLADALVEDGMPFREAHHLVGNVVAHCLAKQIELQDLDAEELSQLTGRDGAALMPSLDPARSVSRRDIPGGPAPGQVKTALADARARIDAREAELRTLHERIALDPILSGS
jgi:argininosuccinate lyase